MMKRIAMMAAAAGLILCPAPASAAQATFTGQAGSRLSACSNAKVRATNTLTTIRHATEISFGQCECEDSGTDSGLNWTCTVEVYYRPGE